MGLQLRSNVLLSMGRPTVFKTPLGGKCEIGVITSFSVLSWEGDNIWLAI